MHLTWDEVLEMAQAGIEFGSHTVSHPILARLEESEMVNEVQESKRELEERLRRDVLAFAYPAGRGSRVDDVARQVVARCGFKFAVTSNEGVVRAGAYDRFALPRIPVEREILLPEYRANLTYPEMMLRLFWRESLATVPRPVPGRGTEAIRD